MSHIDPDCIEVASLSDRGRQRASNQDACGEARAPDGSRLLVLADGMGGHAGGEVASRTAVEAVRAAVQADRAAPEVALRRAFQAANRAIHSAAQRDPALRGMGTTGVALLFSPVGEAGLAHVGDSRAYRLRDGGLEQLTDDHSLVAELRRRGLLSAEDAALHPRRHELLRSIGIEPEVQVDVQRVPLAPGDVFLLCSDGLSGVVDAAAIAEVLRSEPPESAVRRLVELANARGGPDNVTVQIARLPGAEGR